MKLSINTAIRGKPTQELLARSYNQWMNIEADWATVFDLITVDGLATTAQLKNNLRSEANFVSRELIMVDIDNGMTIQELLQNDFYNEYAAGFYVTPSHTDHAHRFRIMFRCGVALTDAQKVRYFNRALLSVFLAGDVACKDASRLFYGTVNASLKECRENVIPASLVESMIAIIDEEEAKKWATESVDVEHRPLLDEEREAVLDLLHGSFVGEYPIWRNIGWALKHSGFSLEDFRYVTMGMMRQKTSEDCAKIWNTKSTAPRPCTMGTIVHFLVERYGQQVKDKIWKKRWYDDLQTTTFVNDMKKLRKEISNG